MWGSAWLPLALVLVLPFYKATVPETALQPEPQGVGRIVEEGSSDAADAGDRVDDIGNGANPAERLPVDFSTDFLGKFRSLSIVTRREFTDFGLAGQARGMEDPLPVSSRPGGIG